MATFNPDVVFSPGAPLDVNKLNQLQANIRSVYDETRSLNNTTTKVGELETTIKTVPIIAVGQVDVKVNGDSFPITFNNTSFDSIPVMVATISSDLKKETFSYSIRATANSTTSGRIEVVSPDTKATNQVLTVNYIAIQMRASQS